MKRLLLFISAIAFGILPSFCQIIHAVEAGQPCPDVEFSHLLNYPKKSAHLSDFRGKLIILDFWDTSCSPCIAAMPKLDSLQRAFNGKLQIIAISQEKTSTIADFIQHTKQIKKCDYRFAFETENSLLNAYFPHIYVPHTVWISAGGKVLAITEGSEASLKNVQDLLAGQIPAFVKKKDRHLIDFNRQDPLSLLKLGKPLYYQSDYTSTGIKFTSFITPYHPDLLSASTFPALYPGVTCTDIGIMGLYLFAYNLAYADHPLKPNRMVLETKRTDRLNPPKEEQLQFEKYLFNYGLLLPDLVKSYDTLSKPRKIIIKNLLGDKMLYDLESYFGYKVSVKKKELPCYVFTLLKNPNLKSKGGLTKETVGPGYLGVVYTNTVLSQILHSLGDYYLRSHPYVNETGIDLPVDLSLSVKLTDWKELARELKSYGIGLSIENRLIDALVFEDR